jgi:phage tail-like protein
MADRGDRLLNSLPAIFRTTDTSGELQSLLGAFEDILFGAENQGMPGIEQEIDAVPTYFAPLGKGIEGQGTARTPDRFVSWLAEWVAFTPHALFTPEQLRKIVAGIVPLYGRRGTRMYLEQLIKLCFDEISVVEIDERPDFGMRVGYAKIGIDTLLGIERPFQFRVVIEVRTPQEATRHTQTSKTEFDYRIRAIIDFAKPAHTDYELRLKFVGAG